MSRHHGPDLATMLRLRRSIGAIGLGLPIVLMLGAMIAQMPMKNSISEFYYSPLREIFIGAAAGVGLFLLAYQGYPAANGEWLTDRRVSNLAGASVLFMAAVPTNCLQATCYPPQTLMDQLIADDRLQATLHLGAAGLFLASLGVMSHTLFTRCTAPPCSMQKERRNLCYRLFGWVIYAMVALVGGVKLVFPELGHVWDNGWHFTFWAESVALWAFGLSWLMKGEALHDTLPYFYEPAPVETGAGADNAATR
ncbi:hypothetical protein K3X48_12185 [Aliiroseovarius crassostreae]|uniref:DUF998 domain-containing protein n=1 Tax=Aliiroseovarius crassostreae TaxID=154981 RepID=A0A9Q9LT81_9RHOB|nr:hypothetical protein [Aliiroseovarius crassostreae]UWP94950.1 hypothetical protein K3X48_12185 [Aliiroseovarius crassostreae]